MRLKAETIRMHIKSNKIGIGKKIGLEEMRNWLCFI